MSFRFLLLTLAMLCAAPDVAFAQNATLTDEQITAVLKQGECTVPLAESKKDMTATTIGKHAIVDLPCWTAVTNSGSILVAVPLAARAKARLLRFQLWDGKRFTWHYSLASAGLDQKTGKLSMFHKLRGIGDCAMSGEWIWSGSDFRMTGFWYKDKCDEKNFADLTPAELERWRVFPKRRR